MKTLLALLLVALVVAFTMIALIFGAGAIAP